MRRPGREIGKVVMQDPGAERFETREQEWEVSRVRNVGSPAIHTHNARHNPAFMTADNFVRAC